MISRRNALLGLGAAGLGAAGLAGCGDKVNQAIGLGKRVAEIQTRHGGRVGVSMLIGSGGDSTKNGSLSVQSTERFAMCSTFKWVLAAAILQQVDQGKLKVAQEIKYTKADLLDYAPVTKMHVDAGKMTIGDLCAAAITLSDNTAANLLLPLVGGPAGLTAFVRGLGDTVTRFDRNEPSLNTNIEKDEKDTTTPEAMSALLRTVFTGSVLKADSLKLLKDWMIATTTGKDRIRAGVPAGYVVGDKTGTGENGAANDVAVIWPPAKDGKEQPPMFLSIYTSGGTLDADGRNKVIADLTRLAFDTLAFASSLDDKAASASASS